MKKLLLLFLLPIWMVGVGQGIIKIDSTIALIAFNEDITSGRLYHLEKAIEIDTSTAMMVKLINIEFMFPVYHWEEEYYGINKGYGDFNLLSFEIIYVITTTEKRNVYSLAFPDCEYYDMQWNKLDYEPLILSQLNQFNIHIDTIRFKK